MTAAYHVRGCGRVVSLPTDSHDHLDHDPRGLVKIYEAPNPIANYVVGCDPTGGIPLWNRTLRTRDDHKIDNGAVEVIRCGIRGAPDVQVAEYAAPIDAEDLADVVNFLGRLYCGQSEFGQALCIIEVWPGPGMLTQRRLINTYGYTHLYQMRYLNTLVPQRPRSGTFGWEANQRSVAYLWTKCTRSISKGAIVIRSPYLVEELSDCEMDPVKMSGKAIYGRHDDRVRALMLAMWAANDWSLDIEADYTPAEPGAQSPNPQATAMTTSQMEDWANAMLEDCLDGVAVD